MPGRKQRYWWAMCVILCVVGLAGAFSALSTDEGDSEEVSPLFAIRTAIAAEQEPPEFVCENVEGVSIAAESDVFSAQCRLEEASAAQFLTIYGNTCALTCGAPCLTYECPTFTEGCTYPSVTCLTCHSTCDSTCANTCDITCSSTCAYTCMGSTCSTCYSTCEATCASCDPPCPESVGFGW
jgi:hypothetical protein